MPQRSSKKKRRDANVLAADIVAEATADGKNPAAVALSRLGGIKGAKALAKALAAEQRGEIAKKAARARWAAQAR